MSISGTNEATQSVPFGAVVATGDANANGTAGTPARSDHVHKGVVAADAWTTYTPTLTQSGAVTKTVTYAKYIQLGKTVVCNVVLTCTGTGTAANAVRVGLPVTAAVGANLTFGSGFLFDASVPLNYRTIVTGASTTEVFLNPAASTVADVLGNTSFTAALASGDIISFAITYEAA